MTAFRKASSRRRFGAERSFDLTKMKAGFERARKRHTGRRGKLGARVKAAYEKYRKEHAKE